MHTATCPECDAAITFSGAPEPGQQVRCRRCGTLLTILQQAPVRLDWAFQAPLDARAYLRLSEDTYSLDS